MTNLKPCPFCGNGVRLEVKSYGYGIDYHELSMVIVCNDCGFEFPRNQFKITVTWDNDKGEYVNDMTEFNKALEAWNKRAVVNEVIANDRI